MCRGEWYFVMWVTGISEIRRFAKMLPINLTPILSFDAQNGNGLA